MLIDVPVTELFTAFAVGVISQAAGMLIYSKKRGVKLLPAELEGRADLVGGISDEVLGTLGNISQEELQAIIQKAKELSVGGYSQAEAMELGVAILRALKTKE